MSDRSRIVVVVSGAEPHAPASGWPTAESAEAALESGADAVLLPAGLLRALCSGHSEAAERGLSRLRHDLNNDLTAVLGFGQLLTRANLPEKSLGYAERIFKHAQRMKERLADSRAEAAAALQRAGDAA